MYFKRRQGRNRSVHTEVTPSEKYNDDREESRSIMLENLSEETRHNDIRFDGKVNQIKNTFQNVFVTSGLQMAAKKKQYFGRIPGGENIQLLDNNLKLTSPKFDSYRASPRGKS